MNPNYLAKFGRAAMNTRVTGMPAPRDPRVLSPQGAWRPVPPLPRLAVPAGRPAWDSPRPRDLAAGFTIQMFRSPSISV